LVKSLAARLARTAYIRQAVAENADLTAFKERPSGRLIIGLVALTVAQLMGWPTVAASGLAAAILGEPLVLLIGPASYLVSWGIFGLAILLIGPDTMKYSNIFLRWAARRAVEKMLGGEKNLRQAADPNGPAEPPGGPV
jgi:hypothetical protein